MSGYYSDIIVGLDLTSCWFSILRYPNLWLQMASRHEDTSVSGLSLPELLQAGWDVQKMVEKGELTGSSENFQVNSLYI